MRLNFLALVFGIDVIVVTNCNNETVVRRNFLTPTEVVLYPVDYGDGCPEECPARPAMVCARCRHQVHRTFLSVCHLRMFNCQHPNEKLELVKRSPCAQSGPFLIGLPTPRAGLSQPKVEDPVLQFIRCKRGRRRDPMCPF